MERSSAPELEEHRATSSASGRAGAFDPYTTRSGGVPLRATGPANAGAPPHPFGDHAGGCTAQPPYAPGSPAIASATRPTLMYAASASSAAVSAAPEHQRSLPGAVQPPQQQLAQQQMTQRRQQEGRWPGWPSEGLGPDVPGDWAAPSPYKYDHFAGFNAGADRGQGDMVLWSGAVEEAFDSESWSSHDESRSTSGDAAASSAETTSTRLDSPTDNSSSDSWHDVVPVNPRRGAPQTFVSWLDPMESESDSDSISGSSSDTGPHSGRTLAQHEPYNNDSSSIADSEDESVLPREDWAVNDADSWSDNAGLPTAPSYAASDWDTDPTSIGSDVEIFRNPSAWGGAPPPPAAAAAAEGAPPAAAKADDEASRSDLPVPVGAPGWIQQAMQELVAGASVKHDRERSWQWAEALLMEPESKFEARPLVLRDLGVFRESGRSSRRNGAATKGKRDRWMNSGGKKGSSVWPSAEDARIRCQYGKILRAKEDDDGSPPLRYHMFTIVDDPLDRRLFVVLAPTVSVRSTTTKVVLCDHDEEGDQPPIRSTNPAYLQVHALVSALETQAATVGDGSSAVAEVAELDRDQVWELLSILMDQPEHAAELQMYGRPPAMADLSRRRCIYAEIGAGKRRMEARKQARINRDNAERQVPAEQEHFDKWMNSGGKRAVVKLQLSNGRVLQRRAGRADRTDGCPATEDLRYYQYSIDTNQVDERSKGGRVATVYHVYSRALNPKLKEKKIKEENTEKDACGTKREASLKDDQPGSKRPKRQTRKKAALTAAGMAVLLYAAYIFGGRGAASSDGTDESSADYDLGECAAGFFLSSSHKVVQECLPRAVSTVCNSYAEQVNVPRGPGGMTESDCVGTCARMGTDACNAISYAAGSETCVAFKGCAGTMSNEYNQASWATVWLRPADQPPVGHLRIDSIHWRSRCFDLDSRLSPQPMDRRCVRCDDCGGDYHVLLPCTAMSDTVCSPAESVWERVNDATVITSGDPKQRPPQLQPQPQRQHPLLATRAAPRTPASRSAPHSSEQMHPPQYAASWQTDGAIYSFGGSASQSFSLDRMLATVQAQSSASGPGDLRCYSNIGGVTDELWKLDRSRTPNMAPVWTRLGGSSTGTGTNVDGATLQPVGRAAAASWTLDRTSGMIFSGQFDLCINSDDMERSSDKGGFWVPPNSMFVFDEDLEWNLLGGSDMWELFSNLELETAISNGFMNRGQIDWLQGDQSTSKRWPLPRSHSQTFMMDGLAYMFSGLFQIVESASVEADPQDTDAESGHDRPGGRIQSMLLNDFWVFDPHADYAVDRSLPAERIAMCANVVERPEIMARSSPYPGPRRDGATWSASTDTRSPSTEHGETGWMIEGWMFGGVGRRISTSGTAVPPFAGISKPKTGGAYSCIAERLEDDGTSSPEVAQVTNLCDMWVFTRRGGWRLVHACERDVHLLQSAGLTTNGRSSAGAGSTLPVVSWDVWKERSPDALTASMLSTAWVEYDWVYSDDAWGRTSTFGHKRAETRLRLFGGVTRCPTRQPLSLVTDSVDDGNLTHQLASEYTMCDVLDAETATVLEPAMPPQCSDELWTFNTRTQAWLRETPPAQPSSSANAPSTRTGDGSGKQAEGHGAPVNEWPSGRCGGYHVAGAIPFWSTAADEFARGIPLYPSQVDAYQAVLHGDDRGDTEVEPHLVTGRSSILLAGGWEGSAGGHCSSTKPGSSAAGEHSDKAAQTGSLEPLASIDIINPAGNDEQGTARCYPADDLWRWEAPRSTVAAK
jgi:hypothetical protein